MSRWRPLSRREQATLAARIYRTFARVAPQVHRIPLPELVEQLSRPPRRPPMPVDGVSAHRLGWMVHRCLNLPLAAPRCLTLSLVLYRLLVERGEDPRLVIGVLPTAPDHRAHAWVELDGRDVGPPPGRGEHLPMGIFGGDVAEGRRRRAWRAAEGWAARAPEVIDLQEHRLELAAAGPLRDRGLALPDEVQEMERLATLVDLTIPEVLEQVATHAAEPVIVFKGIEVAAHYPADAARFFHDLDIIVRDAPAVQRRLLAAGFYEVGDPSVYEDIHHLRPLKWPGCPVVVEVHHAPKWHEGSTPPPTEELFARAVPSRADPDRLLALDPAAHALVLAAHSWSNAPLGRLRDLLDISLVAADIPAAQIDALARRWGMGRLWGTTIRAIDALERPRPGATLALRSWARGTREVRGRTVAEHHLCRWLSAFWCLPPRAAVRSSAREVWADLTPADDEGWSDRLGRALKATRRAGVRKRVHDDRD